MTFLEKYELLRKSVPTPAVYVGPSTIDCNYVDNVIYSKRSYFCVDSYRIEDSLYVNLSWGKKLVDCTFVIESEKCYECVDCTKSYNATYLIDCNNVTDCHFSAFLNSCSDCFGCVALTHKKYCIFNKQYSKDEYFKKVTELNKEKPEKLFKQMLQIKKTIPHPASQQFNTQNCPYGDNIYDSRNSYWCFDSNDCIDSGYVFTTGQIKNCWDLSFSGGNEESKTICERCYEFYDSKSSYNCAFLNYSEYCTNCYYSERLLNCTDCFGCVGLTNKKYCILNNQLSKDQYQKAVKDIKKELGWKV